MSEATPRLALPFIMPGQSQKELFHNEALAALDIAVAPAVEGAAAAAPATPQPGQCWIVAAAAAGDFEGRDHGSPAGRVAGGDSSSRCPGCWSGRRTRDCGFTGLALPGAAEKSPLPASSLMENRWWVRASRRCQVLQVERQSTRNAELRSMPLLRHLSHTG